jgi:hypothetical protein
MTVSLGPRQCISKTCLLSNGWKKYTQGDPTPAVWGRQSADAQLGSLTTSAF